MLEKILSGVLQKRFNAVLFAILILVAGVYAYETLVIDAFPDVTNIQVEIICTVDGRSATEVERTVTAQVEAAMRGLPFIQQIRSVTKYGISIVTIVFNDATDIYLARQLVFERLGEIKERIPHGSEVTIGPVATVMGEIYQYTLQSVGNSSVLDTTLLTELRTVQDWIVSPMLKNVAGVNEVNSFGGYFREYQVVVSPLALNKYGITLRDVFTAIENNNSISGGNILNLSSEQYIVRGLGMIKNISEISEIVVKPLKNVPILLKDVAEIKEGTAIRQGASLINGGQETVGGIVMMLRGANSRDVVKRVEEKVSELNSSGILPDGVRIVPYYNRADIIDGSIKTVTRALLEGILLAIIIIYLLLKSMRGGVVVLLSLPLSLCLTLVLMKVLGISANLMSLGGLAISIGMIIDATVIQVENVQRNLHSSGEEKRYLTVMRAVMEVRKPSIYGEIIIAVTFLPILALEGIEGKMFTPLAITVMLALAASLVVSVFIVPVLALVLLKPETEKESFVMRKANASYLVLLTSVFKRKTTVLLLALGILLASLMIVPFLGTEFVPIMDEGAFDMDVTLLPSVSLSEAVKINELVGRKLKDFSELKTIVARTGQTGLALDTRGPEKTGYVGVFYPKESWKVSKTKEKLTDEMRDTLAVIPGIAFSFSQPIQCRIDELVAGSKAQLIIKLHGENLDTLNKKSAEIAEVLSSIEGATDIMAERQSGAPYLNIEINRSAIARYGINIADVQDVIEMAVAGKTASYFFEENRSYPIKIRLPNSARNSQETIGNILIPIPSGGNIPLSEVATINFTEGQLQVSRENGIRTAGIEVNIVGRDLGSFVEQAKDNIKKSVSLPAGYSLSWGGQFENQERAMAKLLVVLPLSVLLILLLLFFTFGNLRLALLVIAVLPFAMVGGIVALWVTGLYLSVPAAVGFIVLFGVAVLNGIVLISRIVQLREKGLSIVQSVRDATAERLRPVLMTAGIAIFSLLPMYYASGTGSEIQKPLAAVVIGGLITSTFLTLVVIPLLYSHFEKVSPSK